MAVSEPRQDLRVLLLLPFPPRLDATHGGARAIAYLVQALGQRCHVGVVYMRGDDELPIDAPLRQLCEVVAEVHRSPPPPSGLRRLRRRATLALALLRGRPLWVTDWWAPAFSADVRALAERWQPHIVQIEFDIMAQYASALTACAAPRVLTVYDAKTARWQDGQGPPGLPTRLLNLADAWAWRRYRRAQAARMDALVVFTAADRQRLEELGITTKFRQIPLAVPVPEQARSNAEAVPAELLFVGNFMHPPNIDAARRLITSIFPAVRARCSNVRLLIVGPNPPSDFTTTDARMVVTGEVPDVEPYLERASIVVLPIQLGGGMRVKTLEAFAAGKAVVASSIAVEGLPVVDGEQVLLADDDEAFVNGVLELLEDHDRRARLGSAARHWARQHISWNASVAAYEQLYAQLLDEARPRVAPGAGGHVLSPAQRGDDGTSAG
jgi:glycosyltransferase involved in cell wall biosynthesis